MSCRPIFGESFAGPEVATTTTPTAAEAMDTHRLDETRLISEILELHPQGREILAKYFGERCLQKGSMRILSLNLACILHGINIARLLDDLERAQADQGA